MLYRTVQQGLLTSWTMYLSSTTIHSHNPIIDLLPYYFDVRKICTAKCFPQIISTMFSVLSTKFIEVSINKTTVCSFPSHFKSTWTTLLQGLTKLREHFRSSTSVHIILRLRLISLSNIRLAMSIQYLLIDSIFKHLQMLEDLFQRT